MASPHRPAATKRTGARKAAATKRTARPSTPPMSEFDKARAAAISKRTTTNVFEWEGYGRTWHVRRPNPALMAQMQAEQATFMDFVLGHFVEAERNEFLATLAADPEFDIDLVHLVIEQIEKVVYAEIPLD